MGRDTLKEVKMVKVKTRVDVLYDSLATENRLFDDPFEATRFAVAMNKEGDVMEVQVDGKKIRDE